MSRGGSYGGGQSSLGYLFGSDEQPSTTSPPPRPVNPPPYGIDSTTTTTEKPPDSRSPTEKQKVSNNYHRAQGQNSGNFITVSCFFFSFFLFLKIMNDLCIGICTLSYIQFF